LIENIKKQKRVLFAAVCISSTSGKGKMPLNEPACVLLQQQQQQQAEALVLLLLLRRPERKRERKRRDSLMEEGGGMERGGRVGRL